MKYPNLNAEMARIRLSTKDIAKVIKKSPATVSNYLNDVTELPLDKAFLIRDAFFPLMPFEYLFCTKPEAPRSEVKAKEDATHEDSNYPHPIDLVHRP